jgi:hypothetical protein
MIISQSKASQIAGVSRTAIMKLSRRDPTPDFFVSHVGKLKINTEHPGWLDYVKNNQKKTRADDTPKIIKPKPERKKPKKEVSKKEVKQVDPAITQGVKKLDKILSGGNGGGAPAGVEGLPAPEVARMVEIAEQAQAEALRKAREKKNSEIVKRIEDNISNIVISEHMTGDVILEYQELFKAQKLKEEVMIKQLARREKERSLIDVEMGNYLFMGFMEQVRTELSIVPGKHNVALEGFYKNDQSIKAQQLLKKAFSELLDRVIKDQVQALKDWKRGKMDG